MTYLVFLLPYLSCVAWDVQLATLFCWYSALLILWVRRPWYDTAWGDNESLVEDVSIPEEKNMTFDTEWALVGEHLVHSRYSFGYQLQCTRGWNAFRVLCVTNIRQHTGVLVKTVNLV